MIYWKKVEAGNIVKYAPKILQYFYNVYLPKKVIDKWSNSFWNPVLIEDIETYFPEIISNTSQFGKIKELAILLLTTDSSTLHIDHTVGLNKNVKARLNIPILNTLGSFTAFYENLDDLPYHVTPGGTKFWDSDLRYTLTPITSVEVTEPTILRISAPHSVLNKEGIFPRITITISFEEDLVKYLDN